MQDTDATHIHAHKHTAAPVSHLTSYSRTYLHHGQSEHACRAIRCGVERGRLAGWMDGLDCMDWAAWTGVHMKIQESLKRADSKTLRSPKWPRTGETAARGLLRQWPSMLQC